MASTVYIRPLAPQCPAWPTHAQGADLQVPVVHVRTEPACCAQVPGADASGQQCQGSQGCSPEPIKPGRSLTSESQGLVGT